MCVHVCFCRCMSYVCLQACAHVCVLTGVCMLVHVYADRCVYMCVCMQVRDMCVCICVLAGVCTVCACRCVHMCVS